MPSAITKPPLRARDYRHGTVFTVKLEIGGVTFMHVGSANFVESELDGHHCDVLFMCVPGWKRVPEYSTRLPEIVKPRVIVPFHYDDFSARIRPGRKAPSVPIVDMPGFIGRVALSAPQARVRPAPILEPMEFP
jgi:L-ascorbate metabolism protein UlaG (beta-lactamase superfamily)